MHLFLIDKFWVVNFSKGPLVKGKCTYSILAHKRKNVLSRVLRESHRDNTHDGFKTQEYLTYQEPIYNNYFNHTAFLNKLTLHSVEAKEN